MSVLLPTLQRIVSPVCGIAKRAMEGLRLTPTTLKECGTLITRTQNIRRAAPSSPQTRPNQTLRRMPEIRCCKFCGHELGEPFVYLTPTQRQIFDYLHQKFMDGDTTGVGDTELRKIMTTMYGSSYSVVSTHVCLLNKALLKTPWIVSRRPYVLKKNQPVTLIGVAGTSD